MVWHRMRYPLKSSSLDSVGELPEILHHFHSIIATVWMSGEGHRYCLDVARGTEGRHCQRLHEKGLTECGNDVGISPVKFAGEDLLNTVADGLGIFNDNAGILPVKQSRIQSANDGPPT